MLSASPSDDKIAWYENDGNESFTEHEISTDANGANSVYAIDVDNDGDMDVLSASYYDDKVTWYENDGNESFTEHEISTDVNGARSVYAIDVDNDGDIDVLSASRYDDKIVWYESDLLDAVCPGSNVVFSEQGGDATSWSWSSNGSASFNNNALQSPTVSGAIDEEVFTVNVTDAGGCSANKSIQVNLSPNDSYVVSDPGICFDTYTTVIVSGSEEYVDYQLRLDSDDSSVGSPVSGTGDEISFIVSPTSTTVYNILATDISSSCYAELTDLSIVNVYSITTYTVSDPVICIGGTATITLSPSETGVDYQLRLDGDNSIIGSLVAGTGSAITFDVSPTGTTTYNIFAINNSTECSGELSDLSVVTVNPSPAIGVVYGTLNFPPDISSHTISADNQHEESVFAIDVDGDGDIDVLSISEHEGIYWYENIGDEIFTRHVIDSNDDGYYVYAIDVDGDGDIDVLSAASTSLIWYENDGSESFTKHILSTFINYTRSVFAIDVDGDGDIDVLSASGENDRIAWYENDGNENFTEYIISNSADYAQSVYAIDVDGDGDIDVLSASGSDDKIAWYENDGSESFMEHIISTSVDDARSVYAIDIDGDGDIDVLSASSYDDKIVWYENDGYESFLSHTITTSANSARSVYAIDVDNDGDIDVLSASAYDDKIAWYENDGNESFLSHYIGFADGANSVYAVDMDNDGDIDFLSASRYDDKIRWFESNLLDYSCGHDGIVFTEQGGVANSWSWSSNGPATIDFNNIQSPTVDGAINEEIFSVTVTDSNGCTNDKSIPIVINILPDDSYTVSDPTVCYGTNATITVSGSEIGVDYQLRVDANDTPVGVVVSGTGSSISFDISVNQTTIYNVYATTDLCDIELIDLSTVTIEMPINNYSVSDSDICSGETATITVSSSETGVDYQLRLDSDDSNVGASVPGTGSAITFDVSPISSKTYNIFAINNSTGCSGELSDLSVITVNLYPAIGVVYGTPNTPPSFSNHYTSNTSDGASSVFAIDVDNDGDIDILSASLYDDKIAWYENNGNGSFTEHIITTNADVAQDVYAIDIDSDGDIDIISASNYDEIIWYENNGSQFFSPHTVTTTANSVMSVLAIDVDGDGDIDILSASEDDNMIAWYENNGSQAFTKHTISTTALRPNSVYAIDVDRDGDIDVLSASSSDDKIIWYENDGFESFTVHEIYNSADFATSVYAIDMDNDGDIDVLSASGNDYKIRWYENDGNQSFTAHTISSSANLAKSVYAIDMDNDGDIDVLSASGSGNRVSWYRNNGNGSFSSFSVSASTNLATSVYAIDIDNDGDIDVLSSSRNDDKIACYESNLLDPACGSFQLTEQGGDASSWAWSSNGNAVFDNSSLQNPTVSGGVDGEIFSVTANGINGCNDTKSIPVIQDHDYTYTVSGATSSWQKIILLRLRNRY